MCADPTKLAEADPADVNDWTNGMALMATGSPFPPVRNPNGKLHKVAEVRGAFASSRSICPPLTSSFHSRRASRLDIEVSRLNLCSPALVASMLTKVEHP